MKTNIKATDIELTSEINNYIDKKMGGLEKFIDSDPSIQAWVEVGKTTRHHKTGSIFRAEIQIHFPPAHKGGDLRAVSEKENLYEAIDDARDEIKNELLRTKEKRFSLIRQGARSIKKIILGNNE